MHSHTFTPHTVAPYERCSICGTLRRIGEVDLDALYAKDYWNRPGTSTIEEQKFNVHGYKNEAGLTKCESVLKHVPAEGGTCALEIACAPGVMLKLLTADYDNVIGIEYNDSYKDEIQKNAGDLPLIMFGPFPQICGSSNGWRDNWFDFICGMDVLEHSPDPEAFMTEVHRLLKPGGIAVMMLPMFLEDGLFDEKNYHPEHLFLPTQAYVAEWLGESFESVSFDRWIVGHEIVVVKKAVEAPFSKIAPIDEWENRDAEMIMPSGEASSIAVALDDSAAPPDAGEVLSTVKPKRAYNRKPKPVTAPPANEEASK